MFLNLATLNARWRRDPSKYACLLGELSNLCVNVAAVQETHFTCAEDWRVLRDDFDVFSAFDSRCSTGTSLLVGRSLNAGDGGRLVVADNAVKGFEFRVVAVYALNSVGERCSFFRRLKPFLDDPKRIILVGDWNAILDPKIDKARWGASGSDRYESSLINLMVQHDLVDRFRLDRPERNMWT